MLVKDVLEKYEDKDGYCIQLYVKKYGKEEISYNRITNKMHVSYKMCEGHVNIPEYYFFAEYPVIKMRSYTRYCDRGITDIHVYIDEDVTNAKQDNFISKFIVTHRLRRMSRENRNIWLYSIIGSVSFVLLTYLVGHSL